jgi:hypothetical protein
MNKYAIIKGYIVTEGVYGISVRCVDCPMKYALYKEHSPLQELDQNNCKPPNIAPGQKWKPIITMPGYGCQTWFRNNTFEEVCKFVS